MKLRLKPRLPRRSRRFDETDIEELGIIDPGPAFRIIESPHPGESVRRLPFTGSEAERTAGTPGPPLEAGYRWGVAAAQGPCEGAQGHTTSGHGPDNGVEVMPAYSPTSSASLPAVRFERAVLAVAARTEVLASVVARLHERLEDIDDRFVDLVTHEDLVEMESKRARLAAEMARLSVELKGEMDRRISEVGRAVADPRRRLTVDHLGPMDLADAKRMEIQVDQMTEADVSHFEAGFEARRTA